MFVSLVNPRHAWQQAICVVMESAVAQCNMQPWFKGMLIIINIVDAGWSVVLPVSKLSTSGAWCRTELNVLQKVHHPHCVQFFGAVTKKMPYMIITEFMGCGSLADMFRNKDFPSLRRAVQLALDCARGMAYLHNHQPLTIIHRQVRNVGSLCQEQENSGVCMALSVST